MSGPSRDTLLWAAKRTIGQHTEPAPEVLLYPDRPRCPHCQIGGCRLLEWAEGILHAEGVPPVR